MNTTSSSPRAALVLSLTVFVFLSICPQSLFAQNWCSQSYFLRLSQRITDIRFDSPFYKPGECYYAAYNENYPVRLGIMGAFNMNIHDSRFSMLPFYSRTTFTSNPSRGTFTGSIALGSAFGLSVEVPVAEQFAIGVRFVTASHSTSFAMTANNSMDVTLTTLGVETMGIINFDENFRGYVGCAVSGMNQRTYTFKSDFAGTPGTDLPQATWAIVSPLIGIGYDIPLGEPKNASEGRWVLTPELIGLIGMNQVMTNFPANEHWLLSQVRMGFTVKYDWPSQPGFARNSSSALP